LIYENSDNMVFVNRLWTDLFLDWGLYQAIWVTIGLDSDSVLNMWPSIFDPYPHCTVPEHLNNYLYTELQNGQRFWYRNWCTELQFVSYHLWGISLSTSEIVVRNTAYAQPFWHRWKILEVENAGTTSRRFEWETVLKQMILANND
jgi:hypothetical protein